jgi:hypothetical protein
MSCDEEKVLQKRYKNVKYLLKNVFNFASVLGILKQGQTLKNHAPGGMDA